MAVSYSLFLIIAALGEYAILYFVPAIFYFTAKFLIAEIQEHCYICLDSGGTL